MPEDTPSQGRSCGICGRALSKYNKNAFCNSHSLEEVEAFNARSEEGARGNRELRSFVSEFHSVGTVDEMFKEAKKAPPKKKRSVTELEHFHEALRLVQFASLTFHISMQNILRLRSTSKTLRVVRDVLAYAMHEELGMDAEDICTFFGYKFLPAMRATLKRMREELLENEDTILAVDLVLREYRSWAEEMAEA